MKRTIAPLGLAVLIASIVLAQAARPDAGPAEIGKPAPDFELKDVYGKTFRLTEFKDKVVVLEWINQDCPVSRGKHDEKVMQDLYRKYAGRDVVWLAIDSTHYQKPEKNRIYAAQKGLAYPVLHDPDGKVGRAYGAKTTPHMFIIDKKGLLVYEGAIDDQGKTNYVDEALDAVLNGRPVRNAKTKPYGCSVKYK